jgi:uncharacterized caspase-like protein
METMGYWWSELDKSHPRVRTRWWHVALVLCAQTLFVGGGWAQGTAPERRTALVIGNSTYQKSPLVNPVNDAQAMAATLGSLGFTVTKLENASKSQMADAIRQFGESIKRGGVGLFYFAGHGVQVNGENFLIPVDDDIQDKGQVVTKGIEAKLVLQAMSNAKNRINVVILDACRNNPFAQSASRALVPTGNTDGRTRSDSAGGLAPMEALVGTLIAFATAPESVAADGSGKNGVYTENLLRNITEPGLRIEDVFKRTRFSVRQETGGRQVPWENTSLEGDFYFVAPSTSSVASSGSAGQPTALMGGQQAALQPSRSDTPVTRPVRSPSGFSFSREEEKDRTTRFAKDDEIRARLQAPCPEALRQRPIIIDITEESRADGLIATDRSSRFAQLVNQNLQQAGLTTSLADSQRQPAGQAGRLLARAARASHPQGHYSIQGVVLSQQGANRVVRLNEASMNAELALRDPSGRIITMVEVAGERFAGQNTSAAAWALTKEQANDASSQLYTAFCGSRY